MTEEEARQLFRDHCKPGDRGVLERYGEDAAVAAILATSSAASGLLAEMRAIAGMAPEQKPDDPEYDCGNAGDVASAAADLALWNVAEGARAAIKKATTAAETGAVGTSAASEQNPITARDGGEA